MSVSKFIRNVFGANPESPHTIKFEPFCTLEYKRADSEWFGLAKDLNPENWIEISIQSNDPKRPIDRELLALRTFIGEIGTTMDKIYCFMEEKFANSKRPKKESELRSVYYLSSISRRADSSGLWVVLEPKFDVETQDNFLPRFTVLDGEIVWSNLI